MLYKAKHIRFYFELLGEDLTAIFSHSFIVLKSSPALVDAWATFEIILDLKIDIERAIKKLALRHNDLELLRAWAGPYGILYYSVIKNVKYETVRTRKKRLIGKLLRYLNRKTLNPFTNKTQCNNNIEIRFNYILSKYNKDIQATIENYDPRFKKDLNQEIKLKLWQLAIQNKLKSSSRFIVKICSRTITDYIKKNK